MVKKHKSTKSLIDILRDEFHDYLHRGGVVTALQGAFDALHTINPRERPEDVFKFVCDYIKERANGGSCPEDRMMQGELDKLGELERLLIVLRQHLRLVLAAMAPQRYMGLLRGEDVPLGPLPEEEEPEPQPEEEKEDSEAETVSSVPPTPTTQEIPPPQRKSEERRRKSELKSAVMKKKKSFQGRVRFSTGK